MTNDMTNDVTRGRAADIATGAQELRRAAAGGIRESDRDRSLTIRIRLPMLRTPALETKTQNPATVFRPCRIAVLTVSDSRTLETDRSGAILAARIEAAGHDLAARDIVPDSVERITTCLKAWIDDPQIDVVITTGGTGITGRDVTPEAFAAVIEKDIPGFGELFRMLSYAKIGTSTIQSRAMAGVAAGTFLFALPGSSGAVCDGWDDILVHQLDSRHRPCNFVELMPRLREHEPTRP